ncbi:MAG: hypothetical protein ABIQ10_06995 [Gemmatimonadaceae bacterium]
MPLPKAVAAAVCIAVLGAQIASSSPLVAGGGVWYWPFVRYSMYADAHAGGDSLLVPELRAAQCGHTELTDTILPDSLGIPSLQLGSLLVAIGRAPEAAAGQMAEAKVGRAVEAQYPGRYCSASAWLRVVYVADISTYTVRAPMRRVAAWTLDRGGRE